MDETEHGSGKKRRGRGIGRFTEEVDPLDPEGFFDPIHDEADEDNSEFEPRRTTRRPMSPADIKRQAALFLARRAEFKKTESEN